MDIIQKKCTKSPWCKDNLCLCDAYWENQKKELNKISNDFKKKQKKTSRIQPNDEIQLKKKINKDEKQLRYHMYEKEFFIKYPHMKISKFGEVYNYTNGCYHRLYDHELEHMIVRSLDEDGLIEYKSTGNVKSKILNLKAILPIFVETENDGSIINVKNGLLDIKTKELKTHTPEYVSLAQIQVDYDETATCPTWLQCLEEWMNGDDEKDIKIKTLQHYSGYCLTETTKFQKALFIVGDGNNGKSTYVDTISNMLGSTIVSHVSLSGLHKEFGLVELEGKNLNIIEEVSGNKLFESDILKKLISGEPVQVNEKFKSYRQFIPKAKYIFAVNRMPRIDDTSSGMERRILTVSFNNSFEGRENTNLRKDFGILKRELSGIFNWALSGWIELDTIEKKFATTQEHKRIMQEYRDENSSVDSFVSYCIEKNEVGKENEYTYINELYTAYERYTLDSGLKPKGRVLFTKELTAIGKRTRKFHVTPRTSSRDLSKMVGASVVGEYVNAQRNIISTYVDNF